MNYSDYYYQLSEGAKQKTEPEWYENICEYYNVSAEEALKLGTRSDGRKPSLPGSKTCKPVKDMTMEDIWALKPRDAIGSIYDFYRDQGAWSAFRQTVRHLELKNMRKNLMSQIVNDGDHLCEYGCGIAPFSTTLLEEINPSWNLDISLTDIENCEHYLYGQWVLDKIINRRNLKNARLHIHPAIPESLPQYKKNIDTFIIFEVLEHLPSPVAVINNIMQQMSPNAKILENFVKHEQDDDDPGCDLASAASEREEYYKIVNQNFRLIAGPPEYSAPNATRLWVKRS
jgi:hypothetical protein